LTIQSVNLVEEGTLRAVVEATYPLDKYHKALKRAQENARNGKILFVP